MQPYYAVIFTSHLTDRIEGYHEMAKKMEALAKVQPGYLGFESVRDGMGISISYWRDLESIASWKALLEHKKAQQKGKEKWYSQYHIRVCEVLREYTFNKSD